MKKTVVKLPLFVFILLSLLLSGCFDSPKDPVLPSWDVDLNLPILTKSITLGEIIDTANSPNLGLLDSTDTYDSLYVIYVKDLKVKSSLQDSLFIPAAIVPTTLDLDGNTGDGPIKNAIIFNPDPNYHLDTAEFRSGIFKVGLANFSLVDTEYELIIPGFKNKFTGEILKTPVGTIPALEDTIIDLPIEDYIYAELRVVGLNDLDEYKYQAARGFLVVGIIDAAGDNDLDVRAGVGTEKLVLSRVVGDIDRIELPYVTSNFTTGFSDEIKGFKDKLDFDNVIVSLEAFTTGHLKNLKIIYDSLKLTGYDKSSGGGLINPFPLTIQGNDYYKDSLVAGQIQERVFNDDNSNISRFLQNFPEVISIGNQFIVDKNPSFPDSLQVISDRDSIKITANITAPLIISAKDAEYSTQDSINLSDDDRDEINQGIDAKLFIEVDNNIPLGIAISVAFLDANEDTLFILKNDDGSGIFSISPAAVDNMGIPIAPTRSLNVISLTQEEIEAFSRAVQVQATLAVKSTGSTSTTFGPYVRVRAKDFINYRLYGSVKYRVDIEGDDG